MDESFVYFLSALAFVLFMYFHPSVRKSIGEALDKRGDRIKKELSDAVKLRDDAQLMLSEYERKYRNIEQEAATILANAQSAADAIIAQANDELQKSVESRLAAAHSKIRRSEEMALQDVQKRVVDTALAAAESVLTKSLQKDADSSLLQLAAKDVKRIVH